MPSQIARGGKPPTAVADPAMDQLVTRSEIAKHLLKCDPRSLGRLIASGRFPKPDITLSRKFIRWRSSTVRAWVESGQKA